jgi:hypothetical protein
MITDWEKNVLYSLTRAKSIFPFVQERKYVIASLKSHVSINKFIEKLNVVSLYWSTASLW